MIPTNEMVEDCREQSDGVPIAYIDRISFIGRGRKRPKEPDIAPPIFKVPKRMEDYVANNDWTSIWKALRAEPGIAASLAVHAVVGLGRDVLAAASHFVQRFDPDLPRPGRLVGLKKDNHLTYAEILVPIRGGGSELITVKTKGDVGDFERMGGAVDLYRRQSERGGYYRMKQPFVTVAYNKNQDVFEYIDAKEIAAVVRAQYDNLDFCGHWEKIPEVTDFIAEEFPAFPKKKCAFYRHEKTDDGILVFRGTNPFDIADHTVNFAALRGVKLPQYDFAPQITKRVMARYCNRMIVSGHSKGGGIAQYVSAATGVRGVCFNSVGLPDSLVESARANADSPPGFVDHFLVRYDWVSNVAGIYHAESMSIADPFAKERQKFSGKKEDVHFLESPHQRMRFLALHSISTVVRCLEDDPHLLLDTFEPERDETQQRVLRVKDLLRQQCELSGRGTSLNGEKMRKLPAKAGTVC